VYAYGSATFVGNTFDDDVDPGGFPNLYIAGGSGESIVVQNNAFSDPTAADDQLGIQAAMTGTGTTTISGNTFNGFWKGIQVTGGSGTQQISDNTITGVHVHGASMLPGAGIWLEGASTVSLTHNLIQQPGAGSTLGITSNPPAGVLNVEMKRNRVYDHTYGVDLTETTSLTLNGDVIANNAGLGFSTREGATTGLGNADLRNVTVWGNGSDVNLDTADLTLDSSIVEDSVATSNSTVDPFEDPVCTITFSRGPVMNPGQLDGCANFQTTAAPGFVDPTAGINNFHLTMGSPMIDMGSTIAPPPGTLDVDGDPRVVAGVCGGTARADIGADEFVPDCTPPAGPATPTLNPPAAGPQGANVKKKKKCKKKRAQAKKCKR
jgi:hypothetical protein